MNYAQYNAEDFAADDSFKEWVCAPTAESDKFWNDFMTAYPEQYHQVEEARKLVVGLGKLHFGTVSDKQVNRVWSRIEDTLFHFERPQTGKMGNGLIYWMVAASIALLLSVGWWWVGQEVPEPMGSLQTPSTPLAKEWKEAVNEGDKTMVIQLNDGSRIELGKHSHLKYPVTFDRSRREVYLTGEAFFEIQKVTNQPFLVYTNGLITKVLGTSFSIKAHPGEPEVTVSVKTGLVSVYTDKSNPEQDPKAQGVVLSPNQMATFQRKESTISKGIVEKPVLVIPTPDQHLFKFESASASTIFGALEIAYGIKVIYDEELLRNCTLTLNLVEEDLYQKLEVICKVLRAQYKLIDGQVIIYSKGC